MNGRKYKLIEQSSEKPGQWGELARAGHQVVQFKGDQTNRFVAVAVDGEVKEYAGLRSQSAQGRSAAWRLLGDISRIYE